MRCRIELQNGRGQCRFARDTLLGPTGALGALLLFAQYVLGTKIIISRRPGRRFTRSKKFWKALSVLGVAAFSFLHDSRFGMRRKI